MIEPHWPFAYAKNAEQRVEYKGRTSRSKQNLGHECEIRGVLAKCHRCEDIASGAFLNVESDCTAPAQLPGMMDPAANSAGQKGYVRDETGAIVRPFAEGRFWGEEFDPVTGEKLRLETHDSMSTITSGRGRRLEDDDFQTQPFLNSIEADFMQWKRHYNAFATQPFDDFYMRDDENNNPWMNGPAGDDIDLSGKGEPWGAHCIHNYYHIDEWPSQCVRLHGVVTLIGVQEGVDHPLTCSILLAGTPSLRVQFTKRALFRRSGDRFGPATFTSSARGAGRTSKTAMVQALNPTTRSPSNWTLDWLQSVHTTGEAQ